MKPMWRALKAYIIHQVSWAKRGNCPDRLGFVSTYNSHTLAKREYTNRKDFTYRNSDIPSEEHLHLPVEPLVSLLALGCEAPYLRPTAALFLSERCKR